MNGTGVIAVVVILALIFLVAPLVRLLWPGTYDTQKAVRGNPKFRNGVIRLAGVLQAVGIVLAPIGGGLGGLSQPDHIAGAISGAFTFFVVAVISGGVFYVLCVIAENTGRIAAAAEANLPKEISNTGL